MGDGYSLMGDEAPGKDKYAPEKLYIPTRAGIANVIWPESILQKITTLLNSLTPW